MADHIYRIAEIVGTSPDGVDDAIRNAVSRASQTLRNIDWFEMTEIRGHLTDGQVADWQVTVKIGFRLDDGECVTDRKPPPDGRSRQISRSHAIRCEIGQLTALRRAIAYDTLLPGSGRRFDLAAHATTGQDTDLRGPTRPRTPGVAYEALRERIAVRRASAPGTWLREHTVATSLGLSRTPVREALRLLAAEGVVELVHNRGARVVSWSAEDIDEAYRLRALIEGYGAGLRGPPGRPADRRRAARPAGPIRAGTRRRGRTGRNAPSPTRPSSTRPSATTTSMPPCSPHPAAPGCPRWPPWCRARRSCVASCSATTTTIGGAASWRTATSSRPSRTPTRTWPRRR